MTDTTQLALHLVRTDGGTQSRVELSEAIVADYAQAMAEGTSFPPIIVFHDGSDYWLADGFHRYHAAKHACRANIDAEVKQGMRRDAVLYSVGANATHGLRRTNADKRRAVETLLKDEVWSGWSNREIARRCGVTHEFVARVRSDLSGYRSQIDPYVERNGTTYTMNTAAIGQQQNLTRKEFLDEVFPGFTQWRQDKGDATPIWADPRPDIEQQREQRREQAKERIEQLREKGVDLPTGVYSCLVVDPPWPMQKIERDVRPNQVEFDYPTMTIDELQAFPLPSLAGNDCHLYLWTTQKYLPVALRLAEHWGFRYQCLLTWVKNVGFTPFSWMYSTEHVLFCTKGNLPLLTLGKRLDFQAQVREHSRKPDEFYDLVRQVSPGPRLDVFSREQRDGFDQYGNEVGKFAIRA